MLVLLVASYDRQIDKNTDIIQLNITKINDKEVKNGGGRKK